MIQINFKIVRNGFNICNVTYGDYNFFKDAKKRPGISEEAVAPFVGGAAASPV